MWRVKEFNVMSTDDEPCLTDTKNLAVKPGGQDYLQSV